jgi:hypothetical protein
VGKRINSAKQSSNLGVLLMLLSFFILYDSCKSMYSNAPLLTD